MQKKHLVGRTVVGFILVGAVATATFGLAPKKITLEYVGGQACVAASPAKPEVKDHGLFKRKAKWKVAKAQQHDYYWEIEYQASSHQDPDKAGTGNHLGPVDPIDCSENSTISEKAPKGTAGKQWPYKITVYECDKGNKGEERCVRDPIIWIK